MRKSLQIKEHRKKSWGTLKVGLGQFPRPVSTTPLETGTKYCISLLAVTSCSHIFTGYRRGNNQTLLCFASVELIAVFVIGPLLDLYMFSPD